MRKSDHLIFSSALQSEYNSQKLDMQALESDLMVLDAEMTTSLEDLAKVTDTTACNFD